MSCVSMPYKGPIGHRKQTLLSLLNMIEYHVETQVILIAHLSRKLINILRTIIIMTKAGISHRIVHAMSRWSIQHDACHCRQGHQPKEFFCPPGAPTAPIGGVRKQHTMHGLCESVLRWNWFSITWNTPLIQNILHLRRGDHFSKIKLRANKEINRISHVSSSTQI